MFFLITLKNEKDNRVETVLYIFAKTISLIISTVSTTMFVRMILSFFIMGEPNKFYMLTCYITEPFIAPVRALMVRFNILQDSPIDWAFFITAILLSILELILPIV